MNLMKSRLSVLIVLTLVLATTAQGAAIFDRGATWRWRPGTNEASTPVGNWRLGTFNDAQFVTAPSPFWYGDVLPGGTEIAGMQNVYGSIFLRKTFVVTNLAEIGGLRLGSLVDDGFVAWINGVEVLRVSMPGVTGDPVTTSTLAVNAAEPVSFVISNLPSPPSYLVMGTNVLAVQVFQSALNSSDLGFDCSLESILTETNPPIVSSVSPVAGTVSNLNQITVTFNEPVTGVAAAHLVVNGIGAASLAVVDSTTYTFGFVQPPYGPVSITWNPAHNIYDEALPPNRFNDTGPGATWNYTLVDNTAPMIATLSPGAGATVKTLTNITVLFSEPVSGVDASDLLINNMAATGLFTIAPSEYTFTFPQPATGAVQVAWAAGHGITDLAVPSNAFIGNAWTHRLDPNASASTPYISEFMASNTRILADENGFFPDWIEIYNPSAFVVNLDGWSLTDNANNLTKWRFPATNLPSGGFLVVFASGNNRRIPGARLHTDFQLSGGGEYLALVKPDGTTIASQFSPVFPQQVSDVSYGFAQAGSPPEYSLSSPVYFTAPTPGAVNPGGSAVPGPVIESVQHSPNVPLDHQDLLVTARVRPSFQAVSSVTMRYRIMFSNEVTTPMFDDGAHGDGAAGDGLYGATIPANLSTNGQMIRYLIAATDVSANPSRWPLFTNPTNSEEYLGTIVNPTNVTSKLPIFHLFAPPTVLQPGPTTSAIGADSESGGRVAVFYDGEFYDNVYMELRGNTSAGLNKKAHRIEFNRGHEFRHAGPGGRTRKSSFLAEKLDPAYLRQHLSFWLLDKIGVRAPYHYPVRLQLNGQFYQLAFHNDVIGQEQMERLGYDPAGALYKAVGTFVPSFFSTGVFQKLEPDNDPSRTDYLALANGIAEGSAINVRRNTVFDLLDLPQVINHLAGTRWCAENDDVWANMSMYRDTFGDGLWRNIPFDMNASWGQLYGGSNPLTATNDNSKSHPLYGGSQIQENGSANWNRLYDVIIALPETRQMLLRRMRTIMDQMIQPPGTPAESLVLENYVKQMTNLISVEANLDRAKWGFSDWAAGKTFNDGVGDLLNQFIGPRRQHWYVNHCITNTSRPIGTTSTSNAGIPLSQPPNVFLAIVGIEPNPAGGNQEQEYICISNSAPFAVDITGWKIEGGIDFTFAPGTVMPSNGVAYVSPNTRAFRARTTGPRGGQGLFVLGPYKGQLSARGETLAVKNTLGLTLSTFNYTGTPSPAQQFLRVSEIMFHPSAVSGNPTLPDEFEYIELKNISTNVTLSLAGVRFTNGIDFSFTGSAVTSLLPGARVLVVKNTNAFTTRYGGGLPVAGQYVGNLDNDGERIQLLDSNNEEILDFSYDDDWYPITDGLGFSLVIVNEAAEPDAWDQKSQWRSSGALNGSPGSIEPAPPTIAPVLITEALTRSDVPPPTDTIELHNPTAQPVNIGGWWLTDDFNTPAKYRIQNGTTIASNGYVTFDESQFNVGATAFALGSDGDEVWLFSADGAGNLTGYVHGHSFGAADDGASFGRHITSEGKEHFVAQTTRTLGATNSGPRVGPVTLNEIMYRPQDIGGTNDNSDDEYIELLNITGNPVPLFDAGVPTNTWRLRGGVDYDFPTNLTLAAGEYVMLVNFNPTNATMTSAFRAKFSVAPGVRLFGPYSGKLDNAGDDVELKKPATPVLGVTPYVVMDKVDYRDSAPWPGGADGFGLSLQRRMSNAYGNDPASWVAAPPTAAAPTASGVAPVITAHPQSQTLVAYQNTSFSVTATGAATLRYQWRLNGNLLAGATNSLLQLNNTQPEQAGDYDVLVFNNAGSAVSSNATLSLFYPAAILAQPQSVATRPGSNILFSVTAYSSGALTYQWQKNGVNIAGSNGPSFYLPNVQAADSGTYTVVITDAIGPVTTTPATLVILVNPVITLNPVSQSIVPGSTVVLSLSVTNNATLPVGYRLRRNNSTLAPSPSTYFVLNERTVYITLSGTNTMSPWTSYAIVVTNQALPSGLLSTASILTYLTDADGDGLADNWETNFFGSSVANPNVDSDGDGMLNGEEHTAGTDPTNPLSYLKVDSLTAPPGAVLSFGAISNRTYSIQFKDALEAATWSKLTDVPARTNNYSATIPDANYTTNRFYRIATPQQP
jgi:CotH kinase protein/Lamin Tail Domain/Bacterial TSP3 repeat